MAPDGRGETAPRPRKPISSADPIGRAIDEVGPRLETRLPTVDPDPTDLRTFISVVDLVDLDTDDRQHTGLDTAVRLSDEIGLYVDVFDDGLGRALRLQPGLGEVVVEDRDVILLASRLSLEDVHAAVIRAIARVNRAPLAPEPDGLLPVEVAFAATESAAPALEAAGYVEGPTRVEGTVYFRRLAADGLVQVVACMPGSGGTGDDPTRYDYTMMVMAGVYVPEINREEVPQPDRPETIAPYYTTLVRRAWAPPADFAVTVAELVLPWTEATASRGAIAAAIAADPDLVHISQRAQWATVLRGWGHPLAAERLEGARRGPGLVARLLGRHRRVQ